MELRARAGTLLTAASLIASFLGGQLLVRADVGLWAGLALTAFGSSVVLSIYVLLPKDDLSFALDGPAAYGALCEVREDEEEVDRRLATWLKAVREDNGRIVHRLTAALEVAGFALLAEIGFFAVGLAVR